MKKKTLIFMLVACVICLAFALTACKTDTTESTSETESASASTPAVETSSNKPDESESSGESESGSESESGAESETTGPVQLAAPEIAVSDGIVSWTAVEHATSYEIFVNSESMGEQEGTSYAFIETTLGEYKFSVKAKSSSEKYTTSTSSNEVAVSNGKMYGVFNRFNEETKGEENLGFCELDLNTGTLTPFTRE